MPDGTSVPIPEEGGGAPLNSLPWHAIPKFTPGVTNVQEYSQKLQFLASMWPKEHLPLLGPRVALSVEGTAFRKVSRLNPEKLKSPDTSGVALIVTTIGGSWGSTELEESMSTLNEPCMERFRNKTNLMTHFCRGWRPTSLN